MLFKKTVFLPRSAYAIRLRFVSSNTCNVLLFGSARDWDILMACHSALSVDESFELCMQFPSVWRSMKAEYSLINNSLQLMKKKISEKYCKYLTMMKLPAQKFRIITDFMKDFNNSNHKVCWINSENSFKRINPSCSFTRIYLNNSQKKLEEYLRNDKGQFLRLISQTTQAFLRRNYWSDFNYTNFNYSRTDFAGSK